MEENGLSEEDSSAGLQEEFARKLAVNFARETESGRREVQAPEATEAGPSGAENLLGNTGFGSAASALLVASDLAPFPQTGHISLMCTHLTL